MSESLALAPTPVSGERTTTPKRRNGFGAMFKAAMEALVTRQSRQFEDTEAMYRYPPI